MANFLETMKFDFIEFLPFYERPFRAKFIPAKIWKDLDHYKNDFEGLSNYCKKWRTSVQFAKRGKSKVFDEYIAVGGEYHSDDKRIIAFIHEPKFNKFKFTSKTWNVFKFKFIQLLMHELIHFMQFERRYGEYGKYYMSYRKTGKKKNDDERKYLSNFDEIQAYAHCIVLDLKFYRPNKSAKDLSIKGYCLSKTFSYYLKTFNRDHKNNAALNKVLQQVVKWERKYQNERSFR